MHELAITQSLVELALDEAERAGAATIIGVRATVGHMCGIVPESMLIYFAELTRGTMAEGATLHLEVVRTVARCSACLKVFEPECVPWLCPDCAGRRLAILQGEELRLESIEVDFDNGGGNDGADGSETDPQG